MPNDATVVEEPKRSLLSTDYRTLSYVTGPLIFVQDVENVAYNEMVSILMPDGSRRSGQVLDISGRTAVIQVFEGTAGTDIAKTEVRFLEEVAKIDVSDRPARPRAQRHRHADRRRRADHSGGAPRHHRRADQPVRPRHAGRLHRDGHLGHRRAEHAGPGQKLPIFSGSGLPANELAAQIVRQARVKSGEQFAVVFAAMGITNREASYFMKDFEDTGALERVVFFLNLADDPTIERLLTPKAALTIAEYLAFEQDLHVLVILTDMTNYCEALREISTAREEVPGRRGYPGLHVHRPLDHLRARRPHQGPQGLDHADPDPVHARRRHHAPDPRPHRLHHRGPDRALAAAPPSRRSIRRSTCCRACPG